MAEETPTPDEEAPVPEEALAQDAAAEAPAEEAPAEEAAAEEEPADEPPADEAPAEASSAEAPAEGARPKRRRKPKTAPPRASLTPQERQEQRDAERRRKAAVRRGRRQRERERAQAQRGAARPEELPSLRGSGSGQQKIRQGVVVSDRAAKTITVRIDVARRHPHYQKVVRTSTTLHAHDEQGDAHIGDTVIVRECRPLSRTKRWRLIEVVERAR